MKLIITLLFSAFTVHFSQAADSAEIAKRYQAFIEVASDLSDTQKIEGDVAEFRLFTKAAPFVLYVGEDSTRAWKDVTGYKSFEDRDMVDALCLTANATVIADPKHKILSYAKEKDEDGTWYVLEVSYVLGETEEKVSLAKKDSIDLPVPDIFKEDPTGPEPRLIYFSFLKTEKGLLLGAIEEF